MSLHPSLAVPETRIRSSATFLAEAEAAARDARAFVRATEEKYAYPDPPLGSLGGRSRGVSGISSRTTTNEPWGGLEGGLQTNEGARGCEVGRSEMGKW